MAIYRAISTGVASDLARLEVSTDNGVNWSAATVFPTIADDVYANGYTLTFDVDFYANTYRVTAMTGVVAGGGFNLNGGVTVVGDAMAGTVTCITMDAGATQDSYIVGNSFGSPTTGQRHGVLTSNMNCVVHIVGDVYNGNINTTSLSTASHGVYGSGRFRVVGDSKLAYGAASFSCGAAAISITQGCVVEGRSTGSLATANRYATANCIVNEIEGANLNCVVYGKFIFSTTNTQIWTNCLAQTGANVQAEMYSEGGVPFLLNPLYAQGQASPADVRLGISYANGALTGTCAVPPAGAVSLGVPVGATTGTGSVTSAEIRDLILPSILSAITAP